MNSLPSSRAVTAPSLVCRSSVTKVVVHGNGALVSRRGLVKAGSSEVFIEGLPLLFSSDTLRVRPAQADGSCTVGVVDEVCRVGVRAAPPVVGASALLDVRLAIAANEQKQRLMKTLLDHGDVSVELPPPDVDGLPDTALLLRLSKDNAKRRRQLLHEVRLLDEQRRNLRREEKRCIEQVRPDENPPRVLRGLRVVVAAVADAELEVEYFVPAARWVPSYTLHLTSTDKGTQARLVLGALVAQASGEDWDDVELLVSTADLRRDTTLPVLQSWRLGRAQPVRVKGFRPLPSDLPSLFSGWDRFGSLPPQPTTRQQPPPCEPAGGSFEASSEGELQSFEYQRTDATIYALNAAPVQAEEQMDAGAPEADEVSRPSAAFGAPQKPRQRSLTKAPKADMYEEMEAPAPGRGGGGGGPGSAVVDELPPRLRTSAMRMAAADEGRSRGLLLPLDTLNRLEWLLDAADVEADASKAELRRAVEALEEARRRLMSRPLPRGTAAVGGGVAVVFGATSGTRTTIPGDGNDHRVEVHAESADAAIVHRGVPRESLDIWRVCLLKTQSALPAGPVQVYEDGAFVVAARVGGGGGGKALPLNLGVDTDVHIKARTPHTAQSEKGLLNGTTQIDQKVLVEVRSNRSVPVRLSLFERIPVADDNQRDIVVSALSSKPPAVRTDKGPHDEDLKGGLRFDLTLMPGDVSVVEHSYTITLPAKSELVGGNRRE